MRIETGREEVIQYSYICDLCEKSYKHGSTCSVCGRDVCIGCTKFDPRDMGDYPSRYCDSCFKIGEKYLEQIKFEEEKYNTIVEKLEQEWKDESIRTAEEDGIIVHKMNKPDDVIKLYKTLEDIFG